MANVGENKGRRLRAALSRFAAMLIEEARDMSGLTYEKLDDAFGFSSGKCYDYSMYPIRKKTRAPQADEIQNLENLVARLLRRPAHIVVIEEHLSPRHVLKPVSVLGSPDSGQDLRVFDEHDLQLGYESDWPTYRRLKDSPRARLQGIDMLEMYAWQYAAYWEREVLSEPWTREAQGIPDDIAPEEFLPGLVEKAKVARREHYHRFLVTAGFLAEC